jgi:hypothetical protein
MGPLRDARRFRSTRWYPVPWATRTTLGFGICPSFKGQFSVAPCQTRLSYVSSHFVYRTVSLTSVSLTVSPTVSLSRCLPLCLPHCVSHCVSLTVSPTVSLSLSLPLSPSLCVKSRFATFCIAIPPPEALRTSRMALNGAVNQYGSG